MDNQAKTMSADLERKNQMEQQNLVSDYSIRDSVIKKIVGERLYQIDKWGAGKSQSIPGYLLIMRKELEEAEEGWMKNSNGRDSAMSEILQVVAVGIACLEEYENGSCND